MTLTLWSGSTRARDPTTAVNRGSANPKRSVQSEAAQDLKHQPLASGVRNMEIRSCAAESGCFARGI